LQQEEEQNRVTAATALKNARLRGCIWIKFWFCRGAGWRFFEKEVERVKMKGDKRGRFVAL
jgi:hypothetical protein